jgi:glycosyltransferase involved in cell wall biosynthesis
MKILLLSSFFPPTHTAGTEKRTYGYAARLLELGHEVRVICAGDWDRGPNYWNGVREEEYLGIPVKRINLNWALAPDPNRYLYRNPLIADYLGEWIKEFNPDVIHITSCYTLSASVIEVIQQTNTPAVLTLTDFWFICPKHTLLRFDNSLCDGRTTNWECLDCMLAGNNGYKNLRPLLKNRITASGIEWASKQVSLNKQRGLKGLALDMGDRKSYLQSMIKIPDVVIAPSSYLREVLLESGVAREIQVIYSGQDLSWLGSTTAQEVPDLVRFGYIGQITPIKGLHVLLSAFKNNQFEEQARLLIFGNFEQTSDYRDMIMQQLNGNEGAIEFHGGFAHDQLGNVLEEIDVLVVPSVWHENNPRVIQEAFAAKKPVVASNVGGMAEFVKHDKNGLLFDRNDEQDLAYQLSRIINEPGLLKILRNGILPVKRIEQEVDQLIEIYQNIID